MSIGIWTTASLIEGRGGRASLRAISLIEPRKTASPLLRHPAPYQAGIGLLRLSSWFSLVYDGVIYHLKNGVKIKVVFFYQGLIWCSMEESKSRHGVRADNKAQTSISLRSDLLDAAKAAAEKEGRSLSNYIEQLLKQKLPEPEDEKPVAVKPASERKPVKVITGLRPLRRP